jgi:hypothetical protein
MAIKQGLIIAKKNAGPESKISYTQQEEVILEIPG